MKLLVTGATGFLGRYVVSSALRTGHEVRAQVRPSSTTPILSWWDHPKCEAVYGDLRSRSGLTEMTDGIDAILHLAAVKAGSFYEQFGGTVVATENLLLAMAETNVRRLVLVSTFSVYEYLHRRSWSVLDENSPMDSDPKQRDEYAQTKLIQERLVREHAERDGWSLTVVRPGVVYGPENLWTARLGFKGDRLWVRTGAWARLPLTYVENCADAIVAAVNESAAGRTINVVDDEHPSQRSYMKRLAATQSSRPRIIPINWTLMRTMARLGVWTNRLLFGGHAKVPSILRPAALHARCKPLRYRNDRAKELLNWSPRFGVDEAIQRSIAIERGELDALRIDEQEVMDIPSAKTCESHI